MSGEKWIKCCVSRQQVKTDFLGVGVTVRVLGDTDRHTIFSGGNRIAFVQLGQLHSAKAECLLLVEEVRFVDGVGSAQNSDHITAGKCRADGVVLTVGLENSRASNQQSTFTRCTERHISSHHTAPLNLRTSAIQDGLTAGDGGAEPASHFNNLASLDHASGAECRYSNALDHSVLVGHIGCSRSAGKRTSTVSIYAGGVGCQRVGADTLQASERGVDLSFRPGIRHQSISRIQTALSGSQSLLSERIHDVVDVFHRGADFLHQRTSSSYMRPGRYSRAGSTDRQVAVLVHVLGKIDFEVSHDAGCHRSQNLFKLIQFQGFLNVRPFGSYSEVFLHRTSRLTGNDVGLGRQRNITTSGTDGVVVMRTLEVHVRARAGVELVGQKLRVYSFGQDSVGLESIEENASDFACNVTI